MSTRLFEKGRQGFLDGSIDWDTNTIKAILLDLSVTDVAIKAITNATNASPIVVTSNSHGFANNDIVVIRGVLGNLAANGTWKIANVATNTFELVTSTIDALNSTGSAAYTSGGQVINLTVGQNLSDIDAAQIATPTSAFTTPTATNGIADADDPTFSAVTNGTTSHAMATYKDTGTASTSRLISLHDGRHQVVIAGAVAATDTTIRVEPLEAPIPNGTALVFSNGVTLTLTAAPLQFARTLTVSSAPGTIAVGHTADAVSTASPNFPISGNGGNITINIDNAAYRLFKL